MKRLLQGDERSKDTMGSKEGVVRPVWVHLAAVLKIHIPTTIPYFRKLFLGKCTISISDQHVNCLSSTL